MSKPMHPALHVQKARQHHEAKAASAENSARYFAERGAAAADDRKPRRAGRATPAYVTDKIAVPRRKRRILLDLAPETVEAIVDCLRNQSPGSARDLKLEHLLITALEKAR